jgi:hypothetical protein
MKKPLYVILWLTAWAVTPAFGQDQVQTPAVRSSVSIQEKTSPAPTSAATLTKFDLDFPGGSPNELVTAIQKAMGRPLNVIVSNEHASVKLPPLKMKNVNVAQLFQALGLASQVSQLTPMQGGHFTSNVAFGFATEGTASDDSVWYFYFRGPAPSPKASRFFLLTPYLDSGLTVDDITTAIQTGWRLAGISPAPTLSFHKETKLLIAVGDPNQLETIDEVLHALGTPPPTPKAKPEPEKTKP